MYSLAGIVMHIAACYLGGTSLVVACGEKRGFSYRLAHQASMITSWPMPESMV